MLCTGLLPLGAQLILTGRDSSVSFDDGSAGPVRLQASCNAEAAFIRSINESRFESTVLREPTTPFPSLSVKMVNVAPTCDSVPITQPCVAHDVADPDLFWCVFTGDTNQVVSPVPLRASMQEVIAPSGSLIGLKTVLTCQLPSLPEIYAATGYSGDGSDVSLRVGVWHGHTFANATEIPFQGVPQGAVVTVAGMPIPPSSPPSPPPPTSPPPPLVPPPSPPPPSSPPPPTPPPTRVLSTMFAHYKFVSPVPFEPTRPHSCQHMSRIGCVS